MTRIRFIRNFILGIGLLFAVTSCIRDEQSPGYEYMPDMYRSPAVEAYVDYGEIRDTLNPEMMQTISARKPVQGTVPMTDNVMNDMPYTILNTQAGYQMAGEILKSPLPYTEEIIAEGEVIYNNFCTQCHGPQGQGNGAVVVKGGHPAPQAYNGPLKDLPEGKMFHTLTYGKGAMGSHASQLTKEERWKVVAYVMKLQKLGSEEEAAAEGEEMADASSAQMTDTTN
jgi:mono/diheme cytochrome c family protein